MACLSRRLLIALAPIVVVSGLSAPARASRVCSTSDVEWRKFHYDLGNRGSNPFETILSPSTVGCVVLKWPFQMAGEVIASPAVVDGIVYSGEDAGNVYAIDAATGILVWQQHHDGSYASDPAVADGRVFYGTL